MEKFSSEKDWRTRWTAPPQQKTKETSSKRVGKAEIGPHLWPTIRGISKIHNSSSRSEGIMPTSGTSTLGAGTRKMSRQNVWFLKSTGITIRKIIWLEGLDISFLKGSCVNHSLWDPVQKQQIETCLDNRQGDSLINFTTAAREARSLRDFIEAQKCW